MILVVDASAIVAFLVEAGEDGDWARDQLDGGELAAPELMAFEVANTLRRHAAANKIANTAADRAHRSLLALPVATLPYEVLAIRAWQLRDNFTILDASYIALAELLNAPLVTLDRRLARGPGIRCQVMSFDPGP